MPLNAPITRSDKVLINGECRTRSRSKRIWIEDVEKNMIMINLVKEKTLNRTEWKSGIHAVDPKILA